MSRHAVGFPPTASAVVDTVGAGSFFVPPSGCTLYGFDSRSAAPTPVWTWHEDNCDASLLYDEYRNVDVVSATTIYATPRLWHGLQFMWMIAWHHPTRVEAPHYPPSSRLRTAHPPPPTPHPPSALLPQSDDGTTAAFSSFIPNPTDPKAPPTPSLHVFNAQTGAVLYKADQAVAGAGGGTVATSKNGNYVSWSTANGLAVFSPRGIVRDVVTAASGPNELSDSGVYVASCTENAARLFEWDGAHYTENKTLAPPPSPVSDTWFCVDVAMSSDGSGAEGSELVTFAWISGDVLTARVTTFSMVTGKLTTDWLSATNAKLQTNPTIRMDEQYTAVSLWGDSGDVPTVVLLASGSNAPLFTYTTPGSMFAVDVVVDKAASSPTQDTIYIAVAGKATPANVMGNGGDAFAWQVVNTL